jgi:hypothetical protein
MCVLWLCVFCCELSKTPPHPQQNNRESILHQMYNTINSLIQNLYQQILLFAAQHATFVWIGFGVVIFLWIVGFFKKMKQLLYETLDRITAPKIGNSIQKAILSPWHIVKQPLYVNPSFLYVCTDPQKIEEFNKRIRVIREKQQQELQNQNKKYKKTQRLTM